MAKQDKLTTEERQAVDEEWAGPSPEDYSSNDFDGEDEVDLTHSEEDANKSLLPNGWYTVTVEDAEADIAASSGNKRIVPTLVVIEGEHEGAKIKDNINFVFSEKAAEKTRRLIEMITRQSVPHARISRAHWAEQMIGKVICIETKQREYQGSTYPNVQRYALHIPGGRGDSRPVF